MDKEKVAHELTLIAVKKFAESNNPAYLGGRSTLVVDLVNKYKEYYEIAIKELS